MKSRAVAVYRKQLLDTGLFDNCFGIDKQPLRHKLHLRHTRFFIVTSEREYDNPIQGRWKAYDGWGKGFPLGTWILDRVTVYYTFEQVLDQVPEDIQTQLLFHLDLFT